MTQGDPVVKLEEQLQKEFVPFNPSEKEEQIVSDVFFRFRESADSRNRNFEYFDGLNLIEYIEDSVQRFNTNIFERDDMEDWQAAVNDPFTRNKVLTVLGKVMEVLPIAQFTGRGDEDYRKGVILTNLYEYVEDLDDYEELMTHVLLEAIVKGTSIGYEGVDYKERKIRDVKGVNDDIKVTENTEIETRLFGSLVALEDFYPSSVSVRKIKDMPFCFWRHVMPYSTFISQWSQFKKAKFVQPQRTFADDEDRPYYSEYISDDIGSGSVEMIRFYDKMNDQYILIANGIWLNPISGKDGDEIISPLPFNHKDLPFWEVKFDFFGDWFYGKSLPDRLKSMQDVLNVLTNMLMDQSFLTIFPPLLTNGFDSIEDDYLRPGRRTPIDTQGLPIDQAFMKLDLGTPTGWHQYILEYTRNIMEESSLDKVSQGIAGTGDRTTAQEIRVAASGVAALLQLFARMVNNGVKRKAYLKGANILQFGTDPKSPIIRRIQGEGSQEELKEVFNIFEIENTVLTGGKRGTKVIEMYGDKTKLPTKDEQRARAQVSKASSGKEIEFTAFPPEYIRNFKFDTKLIPNPKNEASKEVEKAIQLEKVQIYKTFFPELIDDKELLAQTAEKLGDDPTKIMNDETLNPQPQQPGQQGGQPGNNVQNQSGANQNPGAADLAALQGQLTG
jgi:hypothetical protein